MMVIGVEEILNNPNLFIEKPGKATVKDFWCHPKQAQPATPTSKRHKTACKPCLATAMTTQRPGTGQKGGGEGELKETTQQMQ